MQTADSLTSCLPEQGAVQGREGLSLAQLRDMVQPPQDAEQEEEPGSMSGLTLLPQLRQAVE
jgi:hypothetical protein